jgi:hypothetical protein
MFDGINTSRMVVQFAGAAAAAEPSGQEGG